MAALALGGMLDLIVGDPYDMPHPVRAIGRLIGFLERHLNDRKKSSRVLKLRGLFIVLAVLILPAAVCAALMIVSYRISRIAGAAVEAVITCYMLACRSLYNESMKVYRALADEDTEGARRAVSMIVGRDTEKLSREGIIRAAVETVAENTSDGVTAPLFYLALGGPVLGIIYKSVNTMDSMIGYKDERYKDIGFFAAKLDDILNFIPARLSAFFMILASALAGRDYNAANAFRIFKRDRYKHSSPNSAQCESVCAGALGIRLAGPASYFGKTVFKEYIGDALREAGPMDIVRANRLMLITAFITFIVLECFLWIVM
jgi:adenosylcobinamide-phosphate synthase